MTSIQCESRGPTAVASADTWGMEMQLFCSSGYHAVNLDSSGVIEKEEK